MNLPELTVKEFAVLERVTERTVRVWMAKGAIEFRRTPGGGIRITDRRQALRMSDQDNYGNPSR